jgi:hypothetical protein
MNSVTPQTPQWLMSSFDFFVENYRGDSRELIYRSCQELLYLVGKYGLTDNSNQVYNFLYEQCRYLRENAYNEPKLKDFRDDLTKILGI